ncbi:MAG: hypothetical protein GY757_40105, partial [bacterium]|nr:hypothetical protein [bacterium]
YTILYKFQNNTLLKHLEVNKEYAFSTSVHNTRTRWGFGIAVPDAHLEVSVLAESGEIAFQQEVEPFSMSRGEHKSIKKNFIFNPPVSGKYYLKTRYWDSTGTDFETRENSFYVFRNHIKVSRVPRKEYYSFGETVDVDVEIMGSGNLNLTVTCEKEGFSEIRPITLSPENNNTVVEHFHVPTTFANNGQRYNFVVARIDSTDPGCSGGGGICWIYKRTSYKRHPISIENINGAYGEITANVGQPLDLNVSLDGCMGFTTPLTGTLSVQSSGLGFQDSRTVTITPGVANQFNYAIPVSESIAAGTYNTSYSFETAGKIIGSGYSHIQLPAPAISLSTPAVQFNAGEPFSFSLENSGGQNGNCDVYAYLKDTNGKIMVEHSQTLAIAAGQSADIEFTVPAAIKSGNYFLYRSAKETNTNKESKSYTQHIASGLNATLDAY